MRRTPYFQEYRYVSSTKGRRAPGLWPLASWTVTRSGSAIFAAPGLYRLSANYQGTCPKCRLYAYGLSTSWYLSGTFRAPRLRSFSRKITWFYACRACVASTGMNNNGAFAVRIEIGVRPVVVGRRAPARALDTAPKQADAP